MLITVLCLAIFRILNALDYLAVINVCVVSVFDDCPRKVQCLVFS